MMPKCPHCGRDLDALAIATNETGYAQLDVFGNLCIGKVENTSHRFRCPACAELLNFSWDKAQQFLKGADAQ